MWSIFVYCSAFYISFFKSTPPSNQINWVASLFPRVCFSESILTPRLSHFSSQAFLIPVWCLYLVFLEFNPFSACGPEVLDWESSGGWGMYYCLRTVPLLLLIFTTVSKQEKVVWVNIDNKTSWCWGSCSSAAAKRWKHCQNHIGLESWVLLPK